MKKNYYWLILALLLGLSLATWKYLTRTPAASPTTSQSQSETDNEETETASLTDTEDEGEGEDAEEQEVEKTPFVLPADADDPRIAYSEDGNVRIEFVSPEEDTFQSRQARMWALEVTKKDEGIPGRSQNCTWLFSFGGIPYESMEDNRGCAFTSTFIEAKGTLEVEVRYDIVQGRSVFDDEGKYVEYVQDVIESLTVERTFQVL